MKKRITQLIHKIIIKERIMFALESYLFSMVGRVGSYFSEDTSEADSTPPLLLKEKNEPVISTYDIGR